MSDPLKRFILRAAIFLNSFAILGAWIFRYRRTTLHRWDGVLTASLCFVSFLLLIAHHRFEKHQVKNV
jgi:hypothetical protein